jgi:hypothetical protein
MPNGRVVRPLWLEQEVILDRRIWVFYLVINEKVSRYLKKNIQVKPDERFFKSVGEHVAAFVNKGTMPPEKIAPAIMNLADDFSCGRDIVIRAGDYIALQEFFRG